MKYRYKFCSTYGYLKKGLSFVTPTRDLDKYQSERSSSRCPLGDLNTYTSDTSTSTCSVRDLNKNTFTISTNMCISCCMN